MKWISVFFLVVLAIAIHSVIDGQGTPSFTCPGQTGAFVLVYLPTGQTTCTPLKSLIPPPAGQNIVIGEVLNVTIQPIGPPTAPTSYQSTALLAHNPIAGSVAVYAFNVRLMPPNDFTVTGNQLTIAAWTPSVLVDYRW